MGSTFDPHASIKQIIYLDPLPKKKKQRRNHSGKDEQTIKEERLAAGKCVHCRRMREDLSKQKCVVCRENQKKRLREKQLK